jgi:hypothetical protein
MEQIQSSFEEIDPLSVEEKTIKRIDRIKIIEQIVSPRFEYISCNTGFSISTSSFNSTSHRFSPTVQKLFYQLLPPMVGGLYIIFPDTLTDIMKTDERFNVLGNTGNAYLSRLGREHYFGTMLETIDDEANIKYCFYPTAARSIETCRELQDLTEEEHEVFIHRNIIGCLMDEFLDPNYFEKYIKNVAIMQGFLFANNPNNYHTTSSKK